MIITPETCEFAPRHLLTLVTTRRARDWFRRRYWLRCWTCPLVRGPFTTADEVAQSLDIENSQLRSVDIIRAGVASAEQSFDRKQLRYITEKLVQITGMKYGLASDMLDELIRRFYSAPPEKPVVKISGHTCELVGGPDFDATSPTLYLKCGPVTCEIPWRAIRDALRNAQRDRLRPAPWTIETLRRCNLRFIVAEDPPTFRGIPIQDARPLGGPPDKFPYEPRRDA